MAHCCQARGLEHSVACAAGPRRWTRHGTRRWSCCRAQHRSSRTGPRQRICARQRPSKASAGGFWGYVPGLRVCERPRTRAKAAFVPVLAFWMADCGDLCGMLFGFSAQGILVKNAGMLGCASTARSVVAAKLCVRSFRTYVEYWTGAHDRDKATRTKSKQIKSRKPGCCTNAFVATRPAVTRARDSRFGTLIPRLPLRIQIACNRISKEYSRCLLYDRAY